MKSVKKTSPLGIAKGITAALLIIALSGYFILSDGFYFLSGVFDSIFAGESEKPEEDVFVNVYVVNSSDGIDIKYEAEEVIFDFFRLYYGALGSLSQGNFAGLYTHTSASRAFDEFMHSYLTELRLNNPIALTYPACDIEISYEKAVSEISGLTEITVNVSFSTVFDGLNGISTLRDLRHFFVLRKKSGTWLLDRHEDLSDAGNYFNAIFDAVLEIDGLTKDDISLSYMPKYLDKMKTLLNTSVSDIEIVDTKTPLYEEPYDRDAAVRYALEWTDRDRKIRNLSEYADYADNSVNFTSQCVRAGGIPPDSHGAGTAQWKWHTDNLDESEQSGATRTGFSRSWIDGGNFYLYIKNNTGFGMVAAEKPLLAAEKGDIIQILKPDVFGNTVIYQCIITKIATGNGILESIVTGNSGDIINVPLCVLGYDTARLIKIYGYNTSDYP